MRDENRQYKREGFPGQKLLVVPRSIVRSALAAPVTSQLLVTDCGYFPHASMHGRVRPNGSGQTIVIVCSQGRGWAEVGRGAAHDRAQTGADHPPGGCRTAYGADADDPWTIWWLHLEGVQLPHLVAACGTTVQRPVLAVPPLATCVSLDRVARRSTTSIATRRYPA